MSENKKNPKSRKTHNEPTNKSQNSTDLLKKLFLSEGSLEFDPQKECGKAWSKVLLN